MVEVFEVLRGRDCGCRCPSCRQGVIARQGEKTVWHFAHDPNTNSKPDQVCDLSFFSCCRLYLIQQALAGELGHLALPKLPVVEQIGTYQRIYKEGIVTAAREVQIDQYRSEGHFDLATQLGNYTLALHIHYPGRMPPEVPSQESTGVLVIDITPLEAIYRRGTRRPNRILPIFQSMFEASPDWPGSIEWIHHPRTEAVRESLRQALRQEYDPAADKPDPRSWPQCDMEEFDPPSPVQLDVQMEQESGPEGVFRCLKCKKKWMGRKYRHATCDKCRTHLYSQFLEVEQPNEKI